MPSIKNVLKTRSDHYTTTFPNLYAKGVDSFTCPTNQYREDAKDVAYGSSFLTVKSRVSNHLQIPYQPKAAHSPQLIYGTINSRFYGVLQ